MGTQQLWPGRFRIACSSFHLLLLIIFYEKAQSGFVKVSLSPVILDYTYILRLYLLYMLPVF